VLALFRNGVAVTPKDEAEAFGGAVKQCRRLTASAPARHDRPRRSSARPCYPSRALSLWLPDASSREPKTRSSTARSSAATRKGADLSTTCSGRGHPLLRRIRHPVAERPRPRRSRSRSGPPRDDAAAVRLAALRGPRDGPRRRPVPARVRTRSRGHGREVAIEPVPGAWPTPLGEVKNLAQPRR